MWSVLRLLCTEREHCSQLCLFVLIPETKFLLENVVQWLAEVLVDDSINGHDLPSHNIKCRNAHQDEEY